MMMHQAHGADSCGCVIEVCSVALEERAALQQRLFRVLAACGCWMLGYQRFGAKVLEYRFDVELDAVLEFYCGLAQAGMEITEASHHALTELCVLRSHELTLRGTRCLTPHVVSVRLRVNFVDPAEETAVPGVIAASA